MAFSSKELTTRESTLLGIFLTVFSLLASWIITHWYAGVQIKEAVDEVQERSKENLRTYALKASEKVNNLSSELNKLAVYLEDELNYTEYHSTEDELLAKEERLESAIHLIRTLKSVNDTSLSDWQGVIGDELEELREEQAEKEAEFQNLISRLEDVVENQNADMKGNFQHTQMLRHEIESLRKDLRMAIVGSSGSTLSPKSVRKAKKESVKVNCPHCSSEISYKQRPEGGFKSIQCSLCGSKYISCSSGTGFVLEVRESKKENVKCPLCESMNEVLLDNAPGSFLQCQCSNCHKPFRLTRSPVNRELLIRQIPPAAGTRKLDEQIIELVRKELPPQPWPKGTHVAVARKLGFETKLVSMATDELIQRGVFLPQVSGVLFAPIANPEKKEGDKSQL
jgi:transposase-like protein